MHDDVDEKNVSLVYPIAFNRFLSFLTSAFNIFGFIFFFVTIGYIFLESLVNYNPNISFSSLHGIHNALMVGLVFVFLSKISTKGAAYCNDNVN